MMNRISNFFRSLFHGLITLLVRVFVTVLIVIVLLALYNFFATDEAAPARENFSNQLESGFSTFTGFLGQVAGATGLSNCREVATPGSNLRMRTNPGLGSAVVRSIPLGEHVKQISDNEIEQDNHTWIQVSFGNHPGWVAKDLTKACIK